MSDEKTQPDADSPNVEFQNLIARFADAMITRDGQSAQQIGLELLFHAAQSAVENPSSSQPVRDHAEACEVSGDWQAAEVARKEILTMGLQEANPGFAAKAHWELAIHYAIRELIDEALVHTTDALKASRLSEIPTLVHISLRRHSRILLLKDGFSAAMQAIDEALILLPNEPLTANSRAEALTIRARCSAHLHRFDQADADLREAIHILAPADPATVLPGSNRGMAFWWHAAATVCAKRHDWNGALKAGQEEVTIWRITFASDLTSTAARHGFSESLARLEQYLDANGHSMEAREAAVESDGIRRTWNLMPLKRRPV